jgi:hypothetical protein
VPVHPEEGPNHLGIECARWQRNVSGKADVHVRGVSDNLSAMPFRRSADIAEERLELRLECPAAGRHTPRRIVQHPLDEVRLTRCHEHGGSWQEHGDGRRGSAGELDAELGDVPA